MKEIHNMKRIPKLIKRFIGILLLSSFLILIFNLFVLFIISFHAATGGGPWSIVEETAQSLEKTEKGYVLSDSIAERLTEKEAWAILIDNKTHNVVWYSDNLPSEIPKEYSISDIATLSRTYLKGYPTFTHEYEDGVVVLGFPKTSYWKLVNNSWDYDFIANLPKTLLIVIVGNVLLIFLIYIIANTKLLKSVTPIIRGIEALPTEKEVSVIERGPLSEISTYINQTSAVLKSKNDELKKKETARANWIAGVSHDIRTPLSMVMGYAAQLENDKSLPEEAREKASIVLSQSLRMKNLVNDLNLASKLEYNMQPINITTFNIVLAIRQVVVDFINAGFEDKYSIVWETAEDLTSCIISGDRALINRAITNLIQNSQRHNPEGCTIYVNVQCANHLCEITVEDDGVGVSDEQLEKLNNAPHYMLCDTNTTEQRHGLGLLIVKQVVASHHGQLSLTHGQRGGFSATLTFNCVME